MSNHSPASFSAACESLLAVRVYYEDTDAAGVVYYANYLHFCERARTEWLRLLGFEQQRLMDETATAFVVAAVDARYRVPARLDDQLLVRTCVKQARAASLIFSQNIYRGDTLIFESSVTIACIDLRRGRPAALPDALRRTLSPSPRQS